MPLKSLKNNPKPRRPKISASKRIAAYVTAGLREQKVLTTVVASLAALGCFMVIVGMRLTLLPQVEQGIFMRPEELSPTPFGLPLTFHGDTETIDAKFIMQLRPMHVSSFTLTADDCLQALTINNMEVADPQIPFCDFSKGKTLDLSRYLGPGANNVTASIRNNGGSGSFDMKTVWTDPAILPFNILIVLFPLLLGFFLVWLWKPVSSAYGLFGVFALGAALRVAYVFTTPYTVRAHDVDGHIEYIAYIVKHFALPPADKGWEYWQPPLYYVLASIVQMFTEAFGMSHAFVLAGLQWFALALSLGTLALCLPIAKRLFRRGADKLSSLNERLFLLMMAVFPGLLFVAARINNDVLATFLAFLTIALLLEWWKTGHRLLLYGMFLAAALHIITKGTGYLFLPILVLCLALKSGWSIKRKSIHLLGCLAVVIAVVGTPMLVRPHSSELVGNAGTLNSGLLLTNTPSHFVVFDPEKVLSIPYNNPWSDESRRQYFWEYLFRSAFFGEFDFGVERKLAAQWMLFFGLLTLLLAVRGMARSLLTLRRDLPLFLLFFALLGGHAFFRFRYPYGSSEDFRYSVPALVPYFAFVVRGAETSHPTLAKALRFIILAFTLLCVMFMVSLWPKT